MPVGLRTGYAEARSAVRSARRAAMALRPGRTPSVNTLPRTPIVASSTPSTGAAMPALLLRPDDRAFQSRFAEALQANGIGGG